MGIDRETLQGRFNDGVAGRSALMAYAFCSVAGVASAGDFDPTRDPDHPSYNPYLDPSKPVFAVKDPENAASPDMGGCPACGRIVCICSSDDEPDPEEEPDPIPDALPDLEEELELELEPELDTELSAELNPAPHAAPHAEQDAEMGDGGRVIDDADQQRRDGFLDRVLNGEFKAEDVAIDGGSELGGDMLSGDLARNSDVPLAKVEAVLNPANPSKPALSYMFAGRSAGDDGIYGRIQLDMGQDGTDGLDGWDCVDDSISYPDSILQEAQLMEAMGLDMGVDVNADTGADMGLLAGLFGATLGGSSGRASKAASMGYSGGYSGGSMASPASAPSCGGGPGGGGS